MVYGGMSELYKYAKAYISAIVHVAYISGINIHQHIIDGSESSNQGQTGSNSTATRFQKVKTFGQHSTLNFPSFSFR